MISERILGLDVSTKTGWSLILSSDNGIELDSYGQFKQIHVSDMPYPGSFVDWANQCFNKIYELIIISKPDVIVIEETSAGSKSIYSQKILEYIHYLLAKYIMDNKIKSVYIMTEEWRRITGCLMSKDESKHNKEVKKYKEKHNTNIAYDINGKRIGKITRKHVNIRRANEIFSSFFLEPLKKKDEDLCDSLLLAYAYHLRRLSIEN